MHRAITGPRIMPSQQISVHLTWMGGLSFVCVTADEGDTAVIRVRPKAPESGCDVICAERRGRAMNGLISDRGRSPRCFCPGFSHFSDLIETLLFETLFLHIYLTKIMSYSGNRQTHFLVFILRNQA